MEQNPKSDFCLPTVRFIQRISFQISYQAQSPPHKALQANTGNGPEQQTQNHANVTPIITLKGQVGVGRRNRRAHVGSLLISPRLSYSDLKGAEAEQLFPSLTENWIKMNIAQRNRRANQISAAQQKNTQL